MLPQARALANIHIGTIAGKLNGVMPATTPSGCRMQYTSMPVLGLLAVPALQAGCGMPHANSMFSRPRATSPERIRQHLAVLPRRSSEAISLRLASTSSRMWNITSARRDRFVARHAGNAALAAATAASTSQTKPDRPSCLLPSAGFQTTPSDPRSLDNLPVDPMMNPIHALSFHDLE